LRVAAIRKKPGLGVAMSRKSEAGAILTIEEMAEYLKISKSTLCKLAQEGRVPSQKVGRHWRFRRETIDRWLDEQPAGRSRGRRTI